MVASSAQGERIIAIGTLAEFGSLIPFRWRTPEWQPAIVKFVVVNWLDVELEWQGPQTQAEYEALGALRGWRNREVRAFIEASDWTAKLFASNALQKHNEELDYLRSWTTQRE
jgi:hypothetical protein